MDFPLLIRHLFPWFSPLLWIPVDQYSDANKNCKSTYPFNCSQPLVPTWHTSRKGPWQIEPMEAATMVQQKWKPSFFPTSCSHPIKIMLGDGMETIVCWILPFGGFEWWSCDWDWLDVDFCSYWEALHLFRSETNRKIGCFIHKRLAHGSLLLPPTPSRIFDFAQEWMRWEKEILIFVAIGLLHLFVVMFAPSSGAMLLPFVKLFRFCIMFVSNYGSCLSASTV
jgi:hypothetical protein